MKLIKFTNKKSLFVISILSCIIGCVADVLLLYHPNGNYHIGDYYFFEDISKQRIIWGFYLGILFIGFELLGYWVISKSIFKNNEVKNKLFFTSLSFLFLLGIVYHAVVSFIGIFIKEVEDGLHILNQYQIMFRPLEILMGSCLLVMTIILGLYLRKNNSSLPNWVLLFNPLFVYIFIGLLYLFIPIIGNVLIVAGFNLSNGIFLSACAYALWNKKIDL